MPRFDHFDLRTVDVPAARAFYAALLGVELPLGVDVPPSEDPLLALWPLHEQALARGAKPHWLGNITLDDVQGTMARLTARGCEPLGPPGEDRAGRRYARLRDSAGAILGLRGPAPGSAQREPAGEPSRSSVPSSEAHVAWHQLHTRDVDASFALYRDELGWCATETIPHADVEGGHRLFAWTEGGPSVGSVANTARWQGVHPQWLFYFPVADLDDAIERVQRHGGKVAGRGEFPNGMRLVACDDPQGAAFGLVQG